MQRLAQLPGARRVPDGLSLGVMGVWMINYQKLEREAYSMRLAAFRLEKAAQTTDDRQLFIAYCDLIVHHERIRDIVAGRK